MFDVYNWDFDGYCVEQAAGFVELPRELGVLGPTETSLVGRLRRELVGGLRFLDSLDRSDAFWKGRNNLPTVSKLGDFADAELGKLAPRPTFAWYQLAICVRGWSCHLPSARVWTVERPASIETRWLVEASYLEHAFWGGDSDDAEPMRPVAQSIGRTADYDAIVDTFNGATDETVRSWFEHERRRAG